MNRVRLIVYRQPDSATTTETGYELDLQGTPNVSLNFQFSDIKEPQTRKASFSQTFKLPFTDTNNDFFQNWYNVNLETLIFDTRKRFNAILYVGTQPQFEGFIQLKAVYKKACLYEVVLLSNTADLFTVIGNKPLKDAFKLADGFTYTTDYNHDFTESNIKASWDGTADGFNNLSGVSLRDTTGGVQKIMYDIRVTKAGFFYSQNGASFLSMSQTNVDAYDNELASILQVPITQLRPSIQLKEVFARIINSAGFTFSSNFINGSYFTKLFMTLAGYLGDEPLPMTNSGTQPAGEMKVGNNSQWGNCRGGNASTIAGDGQALLNNSGNPVNIGQTINPASTIVTVPANTTSGFSCIFNELDTWNSQYNYFTRQFDAMLTLNVGHGLQLQNVQTTNENSGGYWRLHVYLVEWDTVNNVEGNIIAGSEVIEEDYTNPNLISDQVFFYNHLIDLTTMAIGQSARVKMKMSQVKRTTGNSCRIRFGSPDYQVTCASLNNRLVITWNSFSTFVYGVGQGGVNIPSCVDPALTQKDFLIDIIQRFNLVIIPDQEDPTNLIIEPYNEFLAQGTIRSWTHKLDLSKEIIIKDTTELQKATVQLSDKEDVDLFNKEIAETQPQINVYGHYDELTINNDFAKGELTNKPIFSPYINGQVYVSEDTQQPTQINNMAVHYEHSYKENEGEVEVSLEPVNPKLFFYRGTPVDTIGNGGNAVTYYLHNQNVAGATITAFAFTNYPVCTPYDIDPSGTDDTFTLSPNTKSLYFDANPPIFGNLTIFNYNDIEGTWSNNTLYGLYWRTYLNSIYNEGARIMECYLYLDEVDISTFGFNDEIFIKDTYWRILKIENYQVGVKATTKVTLLKIIETEIPCIGCDYVIASDSTGSNLYANALYWWCPEDNPNCNPAIGNYATEGVEAFRDVVANESCCTCAGGTPLTGITFFESQGLYPCLANTGSMPINQLNRTLVRSVLQGGRTKQIGFGKFGKMQFIVGSDNNKFSQNILPTIKDDLVIKYNNKLSNNPVVKGESHRLVLLGNTTGNTRGFAHPEGISTNKGVRIPTNTNLIMRVSGITTVVGGTNTTFTVGKTEGFAYFTAFINNRDHITQLGTVGGTPEFAIKESSLVSTCTLNIVANDNYIEFGLDDSNTDTIRSWALTVDVMVQSLANIDEPFDENNAIFQNSDNITFQEGQRMIWN